jgi:hypothetical protein
MLSTSRRLLSKNTSSQIRRTVVEFQNGNVYNKRWHYKWRHAYYGQPKENEHTTIKAPEDAKLTTPYGWNFIGDWQRRVSPGLMMAWNRRSRMSDAFSMYVLPGAAFLSSCFWDMGLGFKILTALPLATLYVRIRDKTIDPDIKETFLREMIHTNEEISKYFTEDTIYVLDYDMEWESGFPCEEKFPEFSNKLFRFFNNDTSMVKGHFVFGDVESGATMRLDVKTMPIAGRSRYQVGEPYFYYDVRAQINHNGVFSEVVLVDEAETLKKNRPYLFMY